MQTLKKFTLFLLKVYNFNAGTYQLEVPLQRELLFNIAQKERNYLSFKL